MCTVTEGHVIQTSTGLLAKLRVKELCLFYMLLTTTITLWKFDGNYTSVDIACIVGPKFHNLRGLLYKINPSGPAARPWATTVVVPKANCKWNPRPLNVTEGGTYLTVFCKAVALPPFKRQGGEEYRSYSFLTSALDVVSDQRHAVTALYRRERTTQYTLYRRLGGLQSGSGHRR
jgi:hypothetical protein